MKKILQEEYLLGNRPKTVCKDCKKRNPGCHSTCQDYISFKKDLEAFNESIRENNKPIAYWSDSKRKRLCRR